MSETSGMPPEKELLPRHLGIIMDGNGRWAKARALPREMGHRAGAKTFSKLLRYCKNLGIPYLTIYAFSTENWKRPQKEVDALMDLLRDYLADVEQYQKENVKLHILGDVAPLRQDLRQMIAQAEANSAQNTGITLNLALNYGGRDEILRAVRGLAQQCASGELSPEDLTCESISQGLYTVGQPDPDFIIRPSGELRLSNFLLWQSAYSELLFMNVLWPDFTPEHLNYALWQYAHRNRRFGGI